MVHLSALPLLLLVSYIVKAVDIPPVPPKRPLSPFYYVWKGSIDVGGCDHYNLEAIYSEAMDLCEKAANDLAMLLRPKPDFRQDPNAYKVFMKTAVTAAHIFGIYFDANVDRQTDVIIQQISTVRNNYLKLRRVNTGVAPPNQRVRNNFRIFCSEHFATYVPRGSARKSIWQYRPNTDYFFIKGNKRFRDTELAVEDASWQVGGYPVPIDPAALAMTAASNYMIAFTSQGSNSPPLIHDMPDIVAKQKRLPDGRMVPDSEGSSHLITMGVSGELEPAYSHPLQLGPPSFSTVLLHELFHLHLSWDDELVFLRPGDNIMPSATGGWHKAYGWDRIIALVQDQPAASRVNPDSYAYFAFSAWHDEYDFIGWSGLATSMQYNFPMSPPPYEEQELGGLIPEMNGRPNPAPRNLTKINLTAALQNTTFETLAA